MDQPKNIFIAFGEWLEQQEAHRRASRQETGIRRSTRWLPSPGSVIFTLLMIGLLLWAQTAGAIPLPGYLNAPDAPSTGTIAYQGRLADAGGNPLTNTVSMEFRLYSAPTGGTPLWEELWTGANSVQVSDGLFNVMLGSLTPIPQSIVTGSASLFLGITAGTDDEMAPRVQLGSVPFAVQALTVPDGSVTTQKLDLTTGEVGIGTANPRAKLDVHDGEIVGSYFCAGHTDTDGTGWIVYGTDGMGLYIDIDTSACAFPTTPMYFASIGGDGGHWITKGATSIYSPSPTGFRIYLRTISAVTPADANAGNWHIQWVGIKHKTSGIDRGYYSP